MEEPTTSDKVMVEVNKIVIQYNEGAILATEALFAIIARYLENQDAIADDDRVNQAAIDRL